MAREPVAIDFIGLGERGHVRGRVGSAIDEERVSRVATRLVRPVPSVPEHPLPVTTSSAAQQAALSRMSPPSDQGFRNRADTSSRAADNVAASNSAGPPPFARPGGAGMCPPPWVTKHALAMRQIQEQSSGLAGDQQGLKGHHSVAHNSPSGASEWELHPGAPASTSHPTVSAPNRFEVFAQQFAQQARKAQQGLRSNEPMKTSPLREEAHRIPSGAEPCFVPHPQTSSSTPSAGFGSPVPSPLLYSRMKPGNPAGVESGGTAPQQHPRDGAVHQDLTMAAAHALARPPTTGKMPQTAQLTIFYSGMVNVYDDVPYDKAQAIMLLAGKGSTMLSSSSLNVFGNSCGPVNPGRPAGTVPRAVSQPPSRAGSPAPQVTTSIAVGRAPSPGPVPTTSNRPAPTITGVELPQARKASLARFLERRKDRVRRPYTHRNNNELAAHETRMRLSRENSPSPSSSTGLPRRSLPRPEAGNQTNLSLNAISAGTGQAVGASTSAGGASEPSSPKLPSPPRERSASEERPVRSPDVKPPPPSPSEDEAAAMETEQSS